METTVINRSPGSVSDPLLSVLSVPTPLAVGVKVNVTALVEPAGKETTAGEKVPVSVQRGVSVIACDEADPEPGVMV